MILFDEFDKTFGSIKAADGMADPQTEMLTLFDGLSQGKKMFVMVELADTLDLGSNA